MRLLIYSGLLDVKLLYVYLEKIFLRYVKYTISI